MDPSDSQVDPTHAGDQSTGSCAVPDKPRSTVGELLSAEILPEGDLRLLEEGTQSVPPDVVGTVQQMAKLYRCDFL